MRSFRPAQVTSLWMLAALAACGGSSPADDATSTRTVPPSERASTASTDDEDTSASAATTSEVGAAENAAPAATTVSPAPASELADLDGIATITMTTPSSGNGEHPLLSWEPIEPAVRYALTVTASDGQAYWAWTGSEHEVWLGGSTEEPPADSGGPYLTEPMTVRVVAVDSADVIIAARRPVTIGP